MGKISNSPMESPDVRRGRSHRTKSQATNNQLRDILKGKVVIVGIGNNLRGDDGLGPQLVKELSGKIDAVCINTGNSPENYVEKIARFKPENILIVDAVDLGLKPGEYKILKKSDIIKSGFTTHDLSPSLFIEYLEKETNADIYLLGIQPKNISFGEDMSGDVKRTLKRISGLIIGLFRKDIEVRNDRKKGD